MGWAFRIWGQNCLPGKSFTISFSLANTIIQFGQQHDALLLIRIGSCYQRNARFCLAEIDGYMRDTRWNIDKITSTSNQIFAHSLAIPHSTLTAQNVDGGFVIFMQMSMGTTSRWDGQQ